MRRSVVRLPRDFWLYFGGQAISNLGSAFTLFALPLLVYKLTGSPTSLGIATATTFLPYLLFGLVIGAVTDRVDRRRMMIVTDLSRAGLIALLPVLALAGQLHVGWIYVVSFAQATLRIFFDCGAFAAVAGLVSKDQLVTANGRIRASFETCRIIGPLLAGVLVATLPVVDILFADAGSFLISACSIMLIRRSFNVEQTDDTPRPRGAGAMIRRVRSDVTEGLRYVWRHPVLRSISIMIALVNFFNVTPGAQLVLLAKRQLAATDSQVSFLYAAGSVGVVGLSLLAGPLCRRLSFPVVTLGALILNGLATAILGLTRWYVPAAVCWAVATGFGVLFNINTLSLRQQIVPDQLLGRILSIAGVIGWSAVPLGALVGSAVIAVTGNVGLVYTAIGLITATIAIGFSRSPLGRAEQYLRQAESGDLVRR